MSRPLARLWTTISGVSMRRPGPLAAVTLSPCGRGWLVASAASNEPGEGYWRKHPSPGRSSFYSDRPPSPTRGEGKRACCPACVSRISPAQLSLVHRPEHLGDRGLRRKDGDELALDPLQQHWVAVVVLALLVEFHVLPRHDGLVAGNVGGGKRCADLFAVGRLRAADGVGQHQHGGELPRGVVVEILARALLEQVVDGADGGTLGDEIEREAAARDHAFGKIANCGVERLLGEAGRLRDDRLRLVAELVHGPHQENRVRGVAR